MAEENRDWKPYFPVIVIVGIVIVSLSVVLIHWILRNHFGWPSDPLPSDGDSLLLYDL